MLNKISKQKIVAIAVSIFFVISMVAITASVPIASAHTPPQNLPTYAYIEALPNPIGVGQTTLVYMWLNRVYGYYPTEAFGLVPPAYAAENNDYRFHNYKLTITDPNGQNTSVTFATIQDATSSQSYQFTPTVAGTYMLTFNFPGQAYNSSGGDYNSKSVMVDDYYMPSSSTTNLTVQSSPIYVYPDSYPLPTQYWTRPIYGENQYWFTIASNWLGTGYPGTGSTIGYGGFTVSANLGGNGAVFFAGDTVGSLTSHIMWTKPLDDGGVVGGNKISIPGNAWFEGSAYNQRYQNPIIVGGKLFYTEPVSFTGASLGPTDCVDLRTGQLIWQNYNIPPLSFAYVYDHEDQNQHGVFPAIISTSNFGRLWDADTGVPLFNVTGAPGGTGMQGPNGELLKLVMTNLGNSTSPNYVLAEWNSSKLWQYNNNPYTGGSLLSPSILNATVPGNPSLQGLLTVPLSITGTAMTLSNSTSLASYSVIVYPNATNNIVVNGGVFNSTDPQNRYDWNYSISWRNQQALAGQAPTVVGAIPGDIMLCYNGSLPSEGATFMGTLGFTPYTYFAVNLNASRGAVGSVLWWNTLQPPAGNATVLEGGIDPVNRVFVEDLRETQTWVGYSLDTGAKLWTTQPQDNFDYYGSQASGSLANTFADGKMFSSAYAGIVYCYDTKTGNRLWTYGNGGTGNNTNSGFEAPGNYPTFVNAIGNGVVYTVTSEHTVEMPVYKGALARAINETTGAEIWTLSSYTTEFTGTSYAVADGFNTWFNSYDNSIYVVGQGPSSTTVQAPSASIQLGRSLVISGTVTDISAGTKQNQQAANYPQGVPVISDASMKDWMGYIYQQKPCPTNATGVPVQLFVLDSNGNYRSIGTATTDLNGAFSLQWTPDITGKYTVTASFAGTNGYWPSSAVASFAVDAAPPTPTPAATAGPSIADQYFVPAIAGLFVVLIVVIILVVLVLIRKRP